MNDIFKIHLKTALKTGPLSMFIFLLMLAYIEEKSILEANFILVFWIIGSVLTTIIALIASLILFGTFERIDGYFKLNLAPRAMYHYFLPFMVFSFALINVFILAQGIHKESRALLFTVDISALLGWSIFTYEKLKASHIHRYLSRNQFTQHQKL
ncbi:hypothetical protein GCM10011506_14210 [Marivirga lumbricoides]|uniref:Uncharacterized protein n=1 Tax=Marivirga lumbricoides TaxID=1046115 RepID=A0ABQ1LW29_9BACT|nr:hypothetical protein GCM10011506_14210 [Marivirga lumbricoides]